MRKLAGLTLPPGDARVLVIQLRAVGDMLLSTPLLGALHQSFPGWSLDVLSEPLPAQVLRNNPHIHSIVTAPVQGAWPVVYLPLLRRLRRRHYQAVIDILSTPGSSALTFATGAPLRVGYYLRGRAWAYTLAVPRSDVPVYSPLSRLRLVAPLGVEPGDPTPKVFPDESDVRVAQSILEQEGVAGHKLMVGLAPWSKRLWRRWDLSRWAEVIAQVSRRVDPVWILFGSESERHHLSELESLPGCRMVWAGCQDLLQVAVLMRRCRVVVGVDNGLKHLAVAAGTPTVTVFVGSDPQVWNPPNNPNHVALDLRRDQSRSRMGEVGEAIETMLTDRR